MLEQNLVEIPENGQNENIEVPETQAGAQRNEEKRIITKTNRTFK